MTLKSMTGYGRAEAEAPGYAITWEVKSVNGRHLDCRWRVPPALRALEAGFEKTVRAHAARGRVELFLTLRITRAELLGVSLNTALAEAMVEAMQAFAAQRGLPFTPDLNRILTPSHLWEDSASEPHPDLARALDAALAAALADWNASRAAEGEATRRDLAERLGRLGEWLETIRGLAPRVKNERFDALAGRMADILEQHKVAPDEARLLQEVAALSDRLDISEELTRLTAHLERLHEVLSGGGDSGKRLDFILQECFREINTCGNKAQSIEISRYVVDFKTELEKCREQVQNLE